jgi:hypothetical protein
MMLQAGTELNPSRRALDGRRGAALYRLHLPARSPYRGTFRPQLNAWGEPYGLVKKVTVPVPMLPVLFCTAVMAAR